MVLPRIEGFGEAVDCDPTELRKYFKQGERVKVMVRRGRSPVSCERPCALDGGLYARALVL
eukprot:92677-Chlamydomonas_euryale.AAC.1